MTLVLMIRGGRGATRLVCGGEIPAYAGMTVRGRGWHGEGAWDGGTGGAGMWELCAPLLALPHGGDGLGDAVGEGDGGAPA